MSKIDERIVAMKFNAAQFHQGVKNTISSLENLKTKLHLPGASKGLDGIGVASDNLSKKLRLEGATKGLDNISAASQRVSLSNIAAGVEGLSAKFGAMGVAGVTAIATITHQAMAAGAQLVKAFTIDPVKAGLGEYEIKMGSIQTILSNTAKQGTKLEDVNAALKELNDYSDKTIYNFAEMTKSVGLFTNSGMKLKDATAMVKGFSNEAAASGANAEQAAGASVQLSQGISKGVIRMEEWRSLTNAGMGGANMKSGIIEISDAMGVLEEKGLTTADVTKDFTGNMEKGFVSAAVMTNYLKIQSGEMSRAQMKNLGLTEKQIDAFVKQQKTAEDAATKVKTFTQLMGTLKETAGSGWAESFETIIGNFDEAKKMWTNVNDALGGMIKKSADARNKILESWHDLGGRELVIKGISNAFKALMAILKPIGDAFRQIFPAKTGKQLVRMSRSFKDFTEKLIIGKEAAAKLKRLFVGVFDVFRIGWYILKGVVRFFTSLFTTVGSGTGGFLSLAAVAGDFLHQIQKWILAGGGITLFFDRIIAARDFVLRPLVNVIGWVIEAFASLLHLGVSNFLYPMVGLIGRISVGMTILFNKIVAGIQVALKPFVAFLGRLVDSFSIFFGKLWEGRQKVIDPFIEFVNRLTEAFSALIHGDISGFTKKLKESFGSFKVLEEAIQSLVSKSKTSLQDVASGVVGTIHTIFSGLISFLSSLGIASFTPIISAIQSLSDRFQSVRDNLNFTPKMDTVSFKTAGKDLAAVDTVGTRVKRVWDGVVNAFRNMAKFFEPITSKIGEIFSSISDRIGGYIKGLGMKDAVGLLNTVIFISLLVMIKKFVKSLKDVTDSFIKIGDSISGAFDRLTSTLKTMQQSVKAGMILKIGIAIGILAASIWVLSKIDPDEMRNALVAITILFTELGLMMVAFSKLNFESNVTKTAFALVLLAIAINILASAVKKLSGLSYEELAKGLGSVGLLLGALVLFTKFADADKGGVKTGAGLILLAIAIRLLVNSVSVLGKMDMNTLIQGIGALGIMLIMLAGIVKAFNNTKGIFTAAAGMLILSVALMALSLAIRIYAAIDYDTFVKGLGLMASTLALIAIAMRLMPENLPLIAGSLVTVSIALMMLAGVLKVLGAMSIEDLAKGLGAIGLSLLFIVNSIFELSKIKGGKKAAKIIMSVAKSLVILAGIVVLLGQLSVTQAAIGLGALAGIFLALRVGAMLISPVINILGAFAVVLQAVGVAMLIAGLGFLAFAGGLAIMATVGTAGFAVITAGIIGLLSLIPIIAQQVGLALVAVAKMLGESAPVILVAATQIFLALLQAIINVTPKTIETLLVLLAGLLEAIVRSIPMFITAAFDLLIGIIGSLLSALVKALPMIVSAGLKLILGLLEGIYASLPGIIVATGKIIVALLWGLTAQLPAIVIAGTAFILALLLGITTSIPTLVPAAIAMVVAFIDGLTRGLPSLIVAAAALITAFLNGIAKSLPSIIAAGIKVVVKLLEGVAKGIGPLIAAGVKVVVALLLGIAKAIGPVTAAAVKVIVAFLEGIAKGLGPIIAAGVKVMVALLAGIAKGIGPVIDAAVDVVIAFVNGVAKNIVRVADAGAKMIIAFINGIATSIRENTPDMIAAMDGLARALIDGLADGIRAGGETVRYAAVTLANAILEAMGIPLRFGSPSKATYEMGRYVVQGLTNGLKDYSDLATKAAKSLATNVLDATADTLGTASPSKEFQKLGQYCGKGFKLGLVGSLSEVQAALDKIRTLIKETLTKTWEDVKSSQEKINKLQADNPARQAAITRAQLALDKAQGAKKKNSATITRAKLALSLAKSRKKASDAALTQAKTENALAKDEHKRAVNARAQLNKNLKDEEANLKRKARIFDGYVKELAAADASVLDKKKAKADFATSITDQYSTLPDIEKKTKLSTYMKSINKEIADNIKFKASLDKLRTLGMDDTTYQKLLSEGVGIQPFLDQLVTSGPAGVKKLNTLNNNLSASASKLGQKAATDMHDAGITIAESLVSGLRVKIGDIEDEMGVIADVMIKALKKKLRIKSPSKVLMEIGKYTNQGLAKGLHQYSNVVDKSATTVGHDAINAMRKSLSGMSKLVVDDMDMTPVIAPILDLSSIKKKANLIGGILTPSQLSLDITKAKANAAAEAVAYRALQTTKVTDTEEVVSKLKERVTFIQNNNSPKSLSNAEIYRQTKNQLSVAKGALTK